MLMQMKIGSVLRIVIIHRKRLEGTYLVIVYLMNVRLRVRVSSKIRGTEVRVY